MEQGEGGALEPGAGIPRVDPYGFERPEDFDYVSYEEFFSRYLVILTRRAIKWSKLLKGNNGVQKSLKVKRYIRKGIPNEHRALIWMIVSGAQAKMEQNPGYYNKLLEGEKSDTLVEAIKTDMNRTFPDNVQFRKTADPCLQQTLYNVLVAYGHHNKTVGYCQFLGGQLCSGTDQSSEGQSLVAFSRDPAYSGAHGLSSYAACMQRTNQIAHRWTGCTAHMSRDLQTHTLPTLRNSC
ncbi:Growth hormone-regulated TBC protein 1 [Chelonia mydas]|uniref:Growth hormone-regulated TBC protein 1 n=1 Tax=Chelonia mydas TaxID=8469 RepID=M7B244_CHEMY|nr:Growth hormone-regulated TBC protein 1 [Chelonia mydas]